MKAAERINGVSAAAHNWGCPVCELASVGSGVGVWARSVSVGFVVNELVAVGRSGVAVSQGKS
jgi:hypothetical protein